MNACRGNHAWRRRLIAQAVLILTPVLLLAGVGCWALRQDRLAAEQETRHRAQELADDLAHRLAEAMNPLHFISRDISDFIATNRANLPSNYFRTSRVPYFPAQFCLDAQKQILFPPPPNELAAPAPLPMELLSPPQLQRWQQIVDSPLADKQGEPAALLASFLAASPPPRFQALALYYSAQNALQRHDTNAAIPLLERTLAQAADFQTESGLLIRHLVYQRLLALWPRERLLALPPTNGVNPWVLDCCDHPSPATPWVIDAADALNLPFHNSPPPPHCFRQVWELRKLERRLAESALAQWTTATNTEPPLLAWFNCGSDWLATRVGIDTQAGKDQPPRYRYHAMPASNVVDLVNFASKESVAQPFWAGVAVNIAGRDVLASGSAEILATARPQATTLPLKVSVFLANAPQYHAWRRQRLFWFAAVIIVSTLAALIGLAASWRAAERQQCLAELKTNFVSSVSHELRAPIASVRLMAESLERGRVPDAARQHEYFRLMGQECRRLSGLIENVLDFARIEQGRKQYEMEPTDLLALVRATVDVMAPAARERQIELRLELPQDAPAVLERLSTRPVLDGRAIQQALINLVDNALKYSPAGTAVKISLAARDLNAVLSVEDQGCGIAPAEQQKIFERFYRVGSELRRETEGVGIGLSLVQHIVEGHGGSVAVQSALGKGSRFVIELPIGNTNTVTS